MGSNPIEMLAPLATPLPEGPKDQFFTEQQWTTLLAIMDTIIPSIHTEATTSYQSEQLTISKEKYNTAFEHLQSNVTNPPSQDLLAKYLEERPSTNPKFQDALQRILVQRSRDDARKGLAFILSALNTRVGSYTLTGYTTPIHEQPMEIRQAIVKSWRVSYLKPLNLIYKSLTQAAKNLWVKSSPTFYETTGFPQVPKDYKQGKHYDYKFEQFPAGSEPETIETDVIVVGSGCGGAVCAKNLAEAGHRVLVVDKGYYFSPASLPMHEQTAMEHLFDNAGVTQTDDGSMTILAGSTWGGGGTVNWSASLQPQGFVRKEWAQDRGLTFFETAEFQNCLDRVCERMGVSAEHIRHNHGNKALLEGSRKLGYTAKAVPQNTNGDEHYCGTCTLGCASGGKHGTVMTWLPDAAKAGAKFVEGFKVEKVLFDESNGRKVATGVKGVWTSRNSKGELDGPASEVTVREVIVKAKKVIVSCGTLWSPIVLLNSGLKNWQIGRNTYLHPVNIIIGVFKEDVRPWEGGILTSVCTSYDNIDGQGHGVKIETCCMVPGLFVTLLDWTDGFDWKLRALKYRHMNGFIVIGRDRDTGRVYPDTASGLPRIAYTPSAFDRGIIMEGNVACAKIAYAAGAIEIHAAIQGVQPFIRDPVPEGAIDPGVTDPKFNAWLQELVKIGNKPPVATYACAHQMGSCRMSTREADGVVDPKGKVWGTEGLYVSDASVFPSASGVNPMITNMAISDWISRGISKELKSEEGTG
ncbi:long chain fatty alcohol oxidase-like protein [Bisporella sp. PMI_857]|nr:long chain fatty alcohol oxidase-like protein [Bisporella sp. PMI_857]